MFSAFLALLFALAPVHAQEDSAEPEVMTPAMRQAEYNRLAEEMQKLASRNAWTGVERFYGLILATEVTLEFDELVTGAHAARAQGDTAAARDRLKAASGLKESRDVIEWLWEIDDAYGVVYLACDLDRKGGKPTLEAAAVPFDPNQLRSVEFAKERIAETCLFDGMLPGGHYTFWGRKLEVTPKIQSVRMDLRRDPEEATVVRSERPERPEKGRKPKTDVAQSPD